jgi:hypothetical protein
VEALLDEVEKEILRVNESRAQTGLPADQHAGA